MRQRSFLTGFLLSLFVAAAPAKADLLELALVVDGSGSITADDWDLQTGAYQSILGNDFYTNFVVPGTFTEVAVAAYIFAGTTIGSGVPPQFQGEYAVFDFLPWTLIDSDQAAADFAALFTDLVQPEGATNTSAAIRVASQGGDVGCPTGLTINDFVCSGVSQAPGLANNGFDGVESVIDISTDGVPTEPVGDGVPNDDDRNSAQAEADAARAAGIAINAIGVGNLDPNFLDELVSGNPPGFFVTASDFTQFESALETKLEVELGVIPLPGALPLFLSALAGLVVWRRRTG